MKDDKFREMVLTLCGFGKPRKKSKYPYYPLLEVLENADKKKKKEQPPIIPGR